MTFRNNNMNNMNNNNNRRNNLGGGNSGHFDRNNYGGTISRNVNPWDAGNNNNNNNINNMRNVGGGNNSDALALANNLLSNLLRNQNHQNVNVPSLLDMAQRGPYDGGYDNRGNNMGYEDHRFRPMGNRGINGPVGNRNGNNNMRRNNVGRGPQNKQMGIRKPNAVARSKNILAKNSNNSKSDPTADHKKNDDLSKNGDTKADGVKDGKRKFSPYADVPNDMFYCHLCTKHMWDSVSFENHLKGRTHQMMKEGVEESYRLKANMLRQEAKISEQLKSIEIDRLKRLGKAIRAANQNREYCTMCDLQFYGHLSTHRKSDGHLILKKFLHPKCEECNTEFHNRTEYDDHLLSPGHMKTSKTPPSYKSDESKKRRLHILTEVDELQGLREEKPKKEKKDPEGSSEKKLNENGEPMEVENKDEENKSEVGADKAVEEDDNEQLEEKDEKPEIEPILDYSEGDEIVAEIETKIPKYNCKRAVGVSLITKLTCFECRLCNKYFDTDVTSEIHSRTFNHHRMFVRFLNEKANETKIAQKRAAAAQLEETDRLKRQKIEAEKPAENGGAAKSELYDPSEATEDKEDDKEEKIDESILAKEEESETVENGQKEEPMKVDEPKVEVPAAVVTPTVTPVVTPSGSPTKQNSPRGRGRGRAARGGRYGRY